MKMKLIPMLLLLLLLPTITTANAVPKRATPFYYIGIEPIVVFTWQKIADNNQYLVEYTETATLTTDGSTHAGTIMLDVRLIAKIEGGEATVSARFVIELDTGKVIEGTGSGKLNMYTNQPDVKFVGHGDMLIQGTLKGHALGFILDGYSW
jgi:hypothetical protein